MSAMPPPYPERPATAMMAVPANAPEFATPGQALAAAPPTPQRMDWRRIAVLGATVVFIAVCGLAILGYVGWNIGPVALTVGIVGAILPVPLLVACFLWLDRYDPEPVKYLAFCFAWGAFVATAFSLAVNTGGAVLFERMGVSDSLVAVLVAPFIEEITKALGPILLLWRRRHAISGIIDAIVYCGLSATGFAMVENILYLGGHGYAVNAREDGALAGAQAVVLIFFARIVMTGFLHPLFTSMTGIGLGVMARSREKVRWVAPLAGILLAMMLHGGWNLMSVVASETEEMVVVLYGYFAVAMPIFLAMIGFTLYLRSAEGRLVEKTLPLYVRTGWFSPPEVATLGTIGRRLSARRWAKRVAGDAGAKAMRAYQFDATRLAILRDGMRRGLNTGPKDIDATLVEERRLLDGIVAYRRVFAGLDPYTPRAIWDGARYHVTFPDGVVRPLAEPDLPVVPVPVVLNQPAAAYYR